MEKLVKLDIMLKIVTKLKKEIILMVKAVLIYEPDVPDFEDSLKTIGANPKSINFDNNKVRVTNEIKIP
ncbi:MAG: hypothetical protein R6W68_07705 [Ignavibacteriaceae bacterium]